MAIAGNPVTGLGPIEELLASVQPVNQMHQAGDGTQPRSPGNAVATRGPTNRPEEAPAEPQTPTLETVDDPAILFQTIDGLSRSQDRIVQNRWAIDLYHRRVRANIPFSYLEKVPNQAIWVAKLPYGVTRERAASTPNKADDLCNKVENAIMADPAKPNPQPHINAESADQAAKLATQYLTQIMGESGIDWDTKHRWGLNVALTCASAFLHYDVDPEGGGYQPKQILAHPQAPDPANPLIGPDGQPTPDPILRYVSAGSPPNAENPEGTPGQFVTEASDAERVWLKGPTCTRMRREQVRLFPPQADIENATGAILVMWDTVSNAMKRFPDTIGQMSGGELVSLAAWRPSFGGDYAVPFMMRGGLADGQTGPSVDQVGTFSPLMQRRMFWYRLYIKKSKEYPKGLQIDISGYSGGTLFLKKTLDYTVTLPVGGKTTRCRDIPLEQIRPQQDVEGGDPMGWAFINRFSGSSDAEQMLYSAYQDAINVRLHPHVFIRSTAAVDDEDWADRSVPVILNPGDPEPTYEQFSPLPGEFLPMIQNMDDKQDSAAGLGGTAQGLETSQAISGTAKQLTMQAADKNLRGILGQFNSAQTRGWRILLQIAQAEFTTPQLIQFTGEDGSSEEQWWTGEDLAGVDDIGIEPGTGTMMTPEGKANLVAFAQAQGWMDAKKGSTIGLQGITRELGLPPDPLEQAIDRALGVFWKGPPSPEWMQQYQAYAHEQQLLAPQIAAYQQLQQVAQETGQPVHAPAPQAQVPPPWSPFTPRPNDSEPRVAEMWVVKLSNAMFSPEYTAQPPEWRAMLEQRYIRARQELQAATAPAPQLPKGVSITAKGDASSIAAEEQAALKGVQPGQPAQSPAPPQAQPVGQKPPVAGTIARKPLPTAGA